MPKGHGSGEVAMKQMIRELEERSKYVCVSRVNSDFSISRPVRWIVHEAV